MQYPQSNAEAARSKTLKIEGNNDGNLLRTAKFYEVVLASGVISRDRLRKRLHCAAAHPITLIAAPAGCGKSIALRDYLETLPVPHLLYEVRAEHDTLTAFVRGFAQAMETLVPGCSSTLPDALRSAARTTQPVPVLASWIEVWLLSWVGVFAIDDLHLSANDPDIAAFLQALTEKTKPQIRWIFSGRSLAHLPISSWVVYGDAAIPIEEDELRFTPDEADQIASALAPNLPREDVQHLRDATAGWATAFTLALRASEFSADAQSALHAARKLSYQYLAEHVYTSLTAQEQALLTFSAVLPAIEIAVLEHAGFAGAAAMLHEIRDRITLLSAASDLPGAYRCHDLFREFLEHQLQLQGEAVLLETRLRAARSLLACGRIIPALHLFIKVRRHGEVVSMLEEHGFDLTQQGYGDEVQAALATLPTEYADNPLVLGLRAQHEITVGHWEQAAILLERAHERCARPGLRSMLAFRLALVWFNMDDERTVPLIESTLEFEGLPLALQGELLALLCAARGKRGMFEGLPALIDRAERAALTVESDVTRMLMLQRIGLAAYYLGDVTLAERVCPRGAAIAHSTGSHRVEVFCYQTLAAVTLMNNEHVAEALAFAERACQAAQRIPGQPYFLRVASAYRIHVLSWSGDSAALEQALAAYSTLPGNDSLADAMSVQNARALLAGWNGEFLEAALLIEQQQFDPVFIENRILGKALCACFFALADEPERAQAIVADSRDAAGRSFAPRTSVLRYTDMARALWAFTEIVCGRAAIAQRLLRRRKHSRSPVAAALIDAVRILADRYALGVRVEDLAEPFQALRGHGHGGFVRIIEAAIARADLASSNQTILTPAELAVLRALASGKAPKQIAFDQGCSINTVRWHTRQIIAKFKCSGRQQAILAARARGIL